jgi:hypothetical protein
VAIEAVVGSKLFTLDELDDAELQSGSAISDFLAAPPEEAAEITIDVADGRTLDHVDLAQARDAAAPSDVVPFTGIGAGKPLTLAIENVYVGDYPDTLKWVPGRNTGDILVTSAHRAFHEVEAAQRAVHLLEPAAERNKCLDFKATSLGTKLVYYSPAVTDMSVTFTFEMSSDRDFNDKLGESLQKAFAGAAGLPVFATAAPYLVIAQAAVPIAEAAAQMLSRPHTFYEESVEINLSRAGLARTQASAFVLYPDEDKSPFVGKYELAGDWVLRNPKDNGAYDGPLPYVVISADGTARPELEGWSALAASALLLQRFFKPDELVSKSLEIATEGLSLYSDAVYRNKAAKALKAAETATGLDKEGKMAQYEAYLKNIKDDGIRESVQRKSNG